jgi:hypothetical protein
MFISVRIAASILRKSLRQAARALDCVENGKLFFDFAMSKGGLELL